MRNAGKSECKMNLVCLNKHEETASYRHKHTNRKLLIKLVFIPNEQVSLVCQNFNSVELTIFYQQNEWHKMKNIYVCECIKINTQRTQTLLHLSIMNIRIAYVDSNICFCVQRAFSIHRHNVMFGIPICVNK